MRHTAKEQIETIYRQINAISALYHTAIAHTEVTDNEFWIWYSLIVVEGEQSQQSICSAWSLSKQTVNRIVSQMVKKGYAVLEAAPGTRNRKVIRLTDTGRKYGESIVLPIFTAEQRAMSRLSMDEITACTKAYEKYLSILKEEIPGADIDPLKP